MSIRVSEKHGLNPTMCTCFFCGEVKEIALLGKLKGDVEAPRQVTMDYIPCSDCQEKFKQGLALIEVVTEQPVDNRPPIQDNKQGKLYPTGRWLVINPEAFNQMVNQNFAKGETCFIDTTIYDYLMEGNKDE